MNVPQITMSPFGRMAVSRMAPLIDHEPKKDHDVPFHSLTRGVKEPATTMLPFGRTAMASTEPSTIPGIGLHVPSRHCASRFAAVPPIVVNDPPATRLSSGRDASEVTDPLRPEPSAAQLTPLQRAMF